jgi:periplasmic copper chaperone A
MKTKTCMVMLILAALLALTGCGGGEASGGEAPGGITVTDAWVRESAMMERAGAAYMVIQNGDSAEDRLLAATTSAAATVELHESKEMNGMMTMSPVEAIVIPAGGQAELKPGGLHVMLIGLQAPLAVGDEVSLTLRFERAGEMTVTAVVREQ